MKINNSELISLLFKQPELVEAINKSIPYISVFKEKTVLSLRCFDISSLTSLLKFQSHLINKLIPFLGFEIHLEYMDNSGETDMAIITERQLTEYQDTKDAKFLTLETLARATGTSSIEAKKLLGMAREVIHPMPDGSEMITEAAFDTVVLQWAKSFKETVTQESATPTLTTPKQVKKPRKSKAKVLTSELSIDDIVVFKTGKNAGQANLSEKGVRLTLEKFFSKVRLEDTSIVDAASAFIEGTGEVGESLRRKILTAYKKFTLGGNPQEIEDKLVAGAKTYLESMAVTGSQESS
ncbi:MAG: hypothetical protein ACFKPT_02690 [Gloeotrichia echinulata GP01]